MGAVIGTPENAERLILGQYAADGRLGVIGSTDSLHRNHRAEFREHLFIARNEHPWPSQIPAGGLGHWANREMLSIHRVDPVVVEVWADRAFDHGRWRHLTRYVRVRVDLDPAGVVSPS